jgi:DNA repair protein RadC
MNEEKKDNLKRPKEKHAHSGHRERLKNRVLKEGCSSLYDHELLELLLFYAIPRRDTNQLAHELIESFGSIQSLMEADVDRICECEGMGESSALLVKAAMELACRYYAGDGTPVYYYDSLKKVVQLLHKMYFGEVKEVSYALLFDNKMKLLDAVRLGEGTVNASPVNARLLIDNIVRRHAASVILAHNHPDGLLVPSYDDLATTRQLYDLLRQISSPLLEHIIVSGKEACPIMQYSGQYDMQKLCEDNFGEEFFHRFYRS